MCLLRFRNAQVPRHKTTTLIKHRHQMEFWPSKHQNPMKKIIQLITSLICFAFCATSVQANTNYWDINGDTAGAGGVTPAGTWDTGTTANWSTDSAGGIATTTWADNDDAIFSAGSNATGAFSVGLGGTPVVGNLTVEEGAIIISGGTALNVGGGAAFKGVIDVYANSTLAISSAIAGGDNTGSITKGISGGTGTGTLVLNGVNTYTGQTAVAVGTLSYDSIGNVNGGASALGNPANAALGTLKIGSSVGATLKYTGTGHTTDRVINLAGASLSGSATNEASGSGPIIFTSGVISTGNGVKVFELAGTNTGDNTISGAIGEFSASKYTRVEKIDSGTWVLTGLNTFSGVCDIRHGTLVVNSLANAGTPSSVGTGAEGGAHTWIGLGGSGTTNTTLKYIGTGHSTSRRIHLWGATANLTCTIDASGTGPLVLRGEITRPPGEAFDKVLMLKGTNTGTNTISGQIADSVSGAKTLVTKEGVGKWVLRGPNAYTGDTAVNGGTLLVNGLGSLAASSAVTVGANATLGGNGTINGPVTVNAGGVLSPGSSLDTFTLNSDLTLAGDLFIEVNKSLSPSNDVVSVAGTLTNAGVGTVTVTNLGTNVLVAGDSFQIFNKAVSNGLALTVVSAGGVVWTNKLEVDGSIAVVFVPVPATNLTIVAAGPTSFSLGGMGAANSTYSVYASTNVTTPMTNWWLIGTTNSNGSGVIQFLDPQATNAQRFYRFGQ
jgi:fibronectin-binding autotransporter adhesin